MKRSVYAKSMVTEVPMQSGLDEERAKQDDEARLHLSWGILISDSSNRTKLVETSKEG
jgi:hypothetical protein